MRKRRFLLGTLLALALFTEVVQAEQEYFLYNGTNLQTVRDDPHRAAACNYWAVWLLKTGGSVAVPSSRWGEFDGKSPDSVMKQLKQAQDFEVTYNRWIHSPNLHDFPYTTFNPVGPICVQDSAFEAMPAALQTLDRIGALAGQISSLLSTIQPLLEQELGLRESNPAKPYYYIDPNVQQYLSQLSKAIKRFSTLYKAHSRFLLGPSMQEVNLALEQARAAVTEAGGNVPKITTALSHASASPPAAGAWTQQQFDFQGTATSQSVQINGGQIQVSQLVVGDPNGQGQRYSFSAQSLDPSAINVSSQAGLWVVSLRSTARNINLQVRNSGGAVTNEVVSTAYLYFSSQSLAQTSANSLAQLARPGH